MDIIDFLEQDNKMAYAIEEFYNEIPQKLVSNNIFMKAMAHSLFAANLEIMVQKGCIKRGKGKNNQNYYFAAEKDSINE